MPTVYITAPPDAASDLAAGLVEERLAACVNRVPCRSTYWWEDAIKTDEEEILFAKTSSERYAELVGYIEREHPYEVPCIERFDEDDVHDTFGRWITEETES